MERWLRTHGMSPVTRQRIAAHTPLPRVSSLRKMAREIFKSEGPGGANFILAGDEEAVALRQAWVETHAETLRKALADAQRDYGAAASGNPEQLAKQGAAVREALREAEAAAAAARKLNEKMQATRTICVYRARLRVFREREEAPRRATPRAIAQMRAEIVKPKRDAALNGPAASGDSAGAAGGAPPTPTDMFDVTFSKLPLGLGLRWGRDPDAPREDSFVDGKWYCRVKEVTGQEALAAGVSSDALLVAVDGVKCSDEADLDGVIARLKNLPCTATFVRSEAARRICNRMDLGKTPGIPLVCPSRPARSAYLFGCMDMKREAAEEYVNATPTQLAKIVSEWWGDLSQEDKAKFEKMAEADRDRYEQESRRHASAAGGMPRRSNHFLLIGASWDDSFAAACEAAIIAANEVAAVTANAGTKSNEAAFIAEAVCIGYKSINGRKMRVSIDSFLRLNIQNVADGTNLSLRVAGGRVESCSGMASVNVFYNEAKDGVLAVSFEFSVRASNECFEADDYRLLLRENITHFKSKPHSCLTLFPKDPKECLQNFVKSSPFGRVVHRAKGFLGSDQAELRNLQVPLVDKRLLRLKLKGLAKWCDATGVAAERIKQRPEKAHRSSCGGTLKTTIEETKEEAELEESKQGSKRPAPATASAGDDCSSSNKIYVIRPTHKRSLIRSHNMWSAYGFEPDSYFTLQVNGLTRNVLRAFPGSISELVIDPSEQWFGRAAAHRIYEMLHPRCQLPRFVDAVKALQRRMRMKQQRLESAATKIQQHVRRFLRRHFISKDLPEALRRVLRMWWWREAQLEGACISKVEAWFKKRASDLLELIRERGPQVMGAGDLEKVLAWMTSAKEVDFAPSASFDGPRAGYVFARGARGQGYYADAALADGAAKGEKEFAALLKDNFKVCVVRFDEGALPWKLSKDGGCFVGDPAHLTVEEDDFTGDELSSNMIPDHVFRQGNNGLCSGELAYGLDASDYVIAINGHFLLDVDADHDSLVSFKTYQEHIHGCARKGSSEPLVLTCIMTNADCEAECGDQALVNSLAGVEPEESDTEGEPEEESEPINPAAMSIAVDPDDCEDL
eukprot:g2205.t1